jgi:hypothetical protein
MIKEVIKLSPKETAAVQVLKEFVTKHVDASLWDHTFLPVLQYIMQTNVILTQVQKQQQEKELKQLLADVDAADNDSRKLLHLITKFMILINHSLQVAINEQQKKVTELNQKLFTASKTLVEKFKN